MFKPSYKLWNIPWLVTRRQCSDIAQSLTRGLKRLPGSAEEAWTGENRHPCPNQLFHCKQVGAHF